MIDMIYDDPLKVQDKQTASRIVIDRYERAKDDNDAREPLYRDWYASYHSYFKADQAHAFRSTLFIPTTFEHLEAHLPRLAAARPRIEVWPRGPEDSAKAEAQRALLFFYWDALRMDMKLVNYAKSALIFGTSWWRVDWRRKTRTVKKMVDVQRPTFSMFGLPVGSTTFQEEQEVEQRLIDLPTVTLVDPLDIFVDPDGYDEDHAGWIIEKAVMTLQELKDAIKPGGEPLYEESVLKELEELSKSGNQVDSIDDAARKRTDVLNTSGRRTQGTMDPFKRQFTILTEWTDDHVRAVVKEHPDLDPIRNEANVLHMKPFVRYTPIPLPNEMNGLAMTEILYSIQYSENLLNNARMDHVMQTVHGMHTIRRASGLQPSQLRFRPSGAVMVNQHDDIAPFNHTQLGFTHYREADYLQQLAARASGATDPYRGIGGASGTTATEASILAQSSASRVGLMFQILSAQSLHRLGKLWIRMSELYMDRERMVRITGPDLEPPQLGPDGQPARQFLVTPEELNSGSDEELDLVIDVSQTEPGTQQFKLQRAQQLIQTVAPFVAPGGPLFYSMVRGALEGLGVNNPEKVIADEQGFVQQQQQAAMQAQAAQAAGAGASDGQNLAIQASADAPNGA